MNTGEQEVLVTKPLNIIESESEGGKQIHVSTFKGSSAANLLLFIALGLLFVFKYGEFNVPQAHEIGRIVVLLIIISLWISAGIAGVRDLLGRVSLHLKAQSVTFKICKPFSSAKAWELSPSTTKQLYVTDESSHGTLTPHHFHLNCLFTDGRTELLWDFDDKNQAFYFESCIEKALRLTNRPVRGEA